MLTSNAHLRQGWKQRQLRFIELTVHYIPSRLIFFYRRGRHGAAFPSITLILNKQCFYLGKFVKYHKYKKYITLGIRKVVRISLFYAYN